MKKYKHIIFDLDDTLVDNIENIRHSFKNIISELNLKYTNKLFMQWYKFDRQYWLRYSQGKIDAPKEYIKPHDKYVSYLRGRRFSEFFNISIEEGIKINNKYLKLLEEHIVEISGASALLKKLSKNCTISVATNGPLKAAWVKIEKINCKEYVKYLFSAEMTKSVSTKPFKAFYEELFEYIGAKNKNEVLIVGDELNRDIQGAMNIGIDCCWLNSANKKCPKKYMPTYVVNNLSQLGKILK